MMNRIGLLKLRRKIKNNNYMYGNVRLSKAKQGNLIKMETQPKSNITRVGSWAFIIGIFLTIIIGLVSNLLSPKMYLISLSILIIMGAITGLLNVTEEEVFNFLFVSVSLVIITGLGSNVIKDVAVVGIYFSTILSTMMAFIIPAALVCALKLIFKMAVD